MVPLEVRCTVIKLACERPDDAQAPLRTVWTLRALRDAAESKTGWRLSLSEIRRLLADEEIQPTVCGFLASRPGSRLPEEDQADL